MVRKITQNDWTSANVQRFWAWYSSKNHKQKEYFTYINGKGLIEFLRSTNKLNGRVLDYGCGQGYLIGYLLDEKLECYGVDSSKDEVDHVNNKYNNRNNWKGAIQVNDLPMPFPSDFFDVITLIETIEHLTDDTIIQIFYELRRIIKPDGIIVITTPNDEDLETNMIYCPFCDSEFHKIQHIQSFNKKSLIKILESNKFKVIYCNNLDIFNFNKYLYLDIPNSSNNENTILKGRFIVYSLVNMSRLIAIDLMDISIKKQFPQQLKLIKKSGKGPNLCAVIKKII